MKSKNNASIWRRLLSSRLLLVIEIVVVVMFSVALTKEIVRRWEVRQEISRLQGQIDELKTQNSELSGLIDYFQSDYYKEREARLKLGLQKEGESALSLPNMQDSSADTLENTKVATSSGSQSVPQKWWDYFFAKQ